MPDKDIAKGFENASKDIPAPDPNTEEKITADAYNDALDNEKARLQRLKNDAFQSIINLRKILSIIVTVGVFLWMLFVAYTIVVVTHKLWSAYLSDSVLLALIGGSTANILGMLTIILVFLFSKKKNDVDYNDL